MSNDECLACHNDPTLTKDENGKTISLHVDDAKFKGSIHSIFGCVDCHTDIKAFPHDPTPVKPVCATCHADQQTAYDHGVHAKAAAAGNTNVAKCQDCHGSVHEILPASDPKSKVARANIPQTCGACHGQKFVMASGGMTSAPFTSYQESVHGKAVAAGSDKAAVCTDCHGEHDILGAGDPKSPINKFNVPNTCAKCHNDVKQQYVQSIHGQAIARGNWQAPVCTDCHGIHTIKAPQGSQLVRGRRATCKIPVRAATAAYACRSEFGMPGGRVDVLSGELSRYGGKSGFDHGGQLRQLPRRAQHSAFSRSRVPPSTTPTWQRPADNAIPARTTSSSPARSTSTAPRRPTVGSKVIGFISRFYIWMIICVIGGMVLHNLIIFRKKLILHRIGHPRILFRMTLGQRIQHLTLLISFFTLVLTGFALRYPSSWLAAIFVNELVRSYHPPHRRRGADRGQPVPPVVCHQDTGRPAADQRHAARLEGRHRRARRIPLLPRVTATTAPCSAASPTPKRWSTGRWCGACSSWPAPD